MLRRVVWSAVVAATLAAVSIVMAALGQDSLSLAVGLSAVVSALLATRERR
jgi:hypothetical protein